MRALVTGCAGFIGSHLTESLLEDGHDVLGIDCFNDNYRRRDKLRNLQRAAEWESFAFVPIDLARGNLFDVVEDCDAIYHLAAEPGVRSSWGARFETYVRNNMTATQHLLEAAKQWPGKPFVYASSSSVYGQAETLPTSEQVVPAPQSPYGMTKLGGEHLCRMYDESYGVGAVTLRLFSVYGPRQRPDMAFARFCAAAIAGLPVTVHGDGSQTRDFTFVADVVRAVRAAADSPAARGAQINVGGGSRTSIDEALDILADISGRRLDVTRTAPERGDVRDTGADTGLAHRLLSYTPATTLRDGLAAQFAWCADTGRAITR